MQQGLQVLSARPARDGGSGDEARARLICDRGAGGIRLPVLSQPVPQSTLLSDDPVEDVAVESEVLIRVFGVISYRFAKRRFIYAMPDQDGVTNSFRAFEAEPLTGTCDMQIDQNLYERAVGYDCLVRFECRTGSHNRGANKGQRYE